jgi:hypothetical protein
MQIALSRHPDAKLSLRRLRCAIGADCGSPAPEALSCCLAEEGISGRQTRSCLDACGAIQAAAL